ncbi:hypothetical protein MRX96_057676 [Rhipicephalus microplus]
MRWPGFQSLQLHELLKVRQREMACYTSEGMELTRVTVVGWHLRPIYEKLAKPRGQILDYNTRFSGLTEEDMVGVKTNLRDVQAALLARFLADTIFLGHSLDSDLRALLLIHETIVDTAAVFPPPMGTLLQTSPAYPHGRTPQQDQPEWR